MYLWNLILLISTVKFYFLKIIEIFYCFVIFIINVYNFFIINNNSILLFSKCQQHCVLFYFFKINRSCDYCKIKTLGKVVEKVDGRNIFDNDDRI